MFPNRGPFSAPAFLQQVPVRGFSLGAKVYNGEVSFVGDQICKIAEAMNSGPLDPREANLYQDEFNRWYDRVAPVEWMEAQLAEYIAQMCPEAVKTFNLMRSDWMKRRAIYRMVPPPPPPVGKPVPSTDRPSIWTPKPPPPPPPSPLSLPAVPSVDTSTSSTPPPPPPPSTTSMVQPEAEPVATQSAGGEPCPPGQFPAYPGGPCRGAVATGMMRPGGGGLPTLPGGIFDTANVANLTPAGGGFGGFAGLAGRIPVVNVRRGS